MKRGGGGAQFERSASLFPWAVLTVSLTITVVATLLVSQAVDNQESTKFRAEAQRTQDQIRNRVSSIVALLQGMKGMFYKNHDARLGDFQNFAQGLDLDHHFAGLTGIGYIANLSDVAPESLRERLKEDGIKDFHEWPIGAKPDYSVLYLEPSQEHDPLVGFVTSSQPALRKTMEDAIASGDTQFSKPLKFQYDRALQGRTAFFVIVPVFYANDQIRSVSEQRGHLVGFVFAPIIAEDLIGSIFGDNIAGKVYLGDPTEANLIYDSISKHPMPHGYVSRFQVASPTTVDGHKMWFQFQSTPGSDADSDRWLIPLTAIVGVMVSCLLFLFTNMEAIARMRAQREAGERRLAQQALGMSERRLRHLIEQSPLSIQVISPEGDTVEVNSGFVRLWGLTLADLHNVDFLDHPYLKDCGLLPYLLRAADGTPTMLPVTFFDPKGILGRGNAKWIAGSAYPLMDDDGHVREIVLMHQDLTDLKQKEEEIVRINAYLEQRVEERTEALAGAMSEMEAFSYSVAHDLRAPLRAMGSFAKILSEDYAEHLNEEACNYLSRIVENSIRMGALIDGLLDLARISRATLEKDDVDLSSMAEEIMLNIAKRHPTPWARTEVQPGLHVRADSRLIHSALENLLDNAWKFTQKSSDPCIEFGTEMRDGEIAYFVRDNGAGFDPSYTSKLFKPFERLHTGSEFPGTGIGLATVRRIIERHGGRVWAESELNKGATFYFTLPPGAMKQNPPLDASELDLGSATTFSASRGHLT